MVRHLPRWLRVQKRLEHVSMQAQRNVLAAVSLAEAGEKNTAILSQSLTEAWTSLFTGARLRPPSLLRGLNILPRPRGRVIRPPIRAAEATPDQAYNQDYHMRARGLPPLDKLHTVYDHLREAAPSRDRSRSPQMAPQLEAAKMDLDTEDEAARCL